LSGDDDINVGKISGVFGIKGWLKIFSYTEPRDNILSYKLWLLKKDNQVKTIKVINGRLQGKSVVAQLDGIDSREQAELLVGHQIDITRQQLPKPEQDEYYWTDLLGLDVENTDSVHLGKVDSLFETGANDVLIVIGERERAIPFVIGQTVKSVDLESRKIVVDWDADF
jgi:16S rRNA processing protein RimM